MASGTKDIQFRELKDTISQLNITIRTQNDRITSLQKLLEDRNAKDDEKDRIISNLQAPIIFLNRLMLSSPCAPRLILIVAAYWIKCLMHVSISNLSCLSFEAIVFS